jgi:uncharacterized metal-binding protein
MAKKEYAPSCATCNIEIAERICYVQKGKGGKGCPTLTKKEIIEKANENYKNKDIWEFARQASIQEAECYANRDQKPYIIQPEKTRIVEICEFARKMGYKRLGLAFCIGLSKEAEMVHDIFTLQGFEVVSAMCKAGSTPKEYIGLTDEQKVRRGTNENMCNPIVQATLLNEEKTDFNVLLGLCVGHDSLFFKYAEAPTTVLAVKDRVTGHNPLAAVYLSHSYYRKLKTKGM